MSSTLLLLLTVFCLSISAAMLLHFLSSIVIFMLTDSLNLLTACLHPSRGLAAQDFPLRLTPLPPKFLIQELTSISVFHPCYWQTLEQPSFVCISSFLRLKSFYNGSVKSPLLSKLITFLSCSLTFFFLGGAASGLPPPPFCYALWLATPKSTLLTGLWRYEIIRCGGGQGSRGWRKLMNPARSYLGWEGSLHGDLPRVWRRMLGDATRPPAYAPFVCLI